MLAFIFWVLLSEDANSCNLSLRFKRNFGMKDVRNSWVWTELNTESSKKNLAKFSDAVSIRADGLCFSSPRLVGGRKAGKLKHATIFLHHAVELLR